MRDEFDRRYDFGVNFLVECDLRLIVSLKRINELIDDDTWMCERIILVIILLFIRHFLSKAQLEMI